MIPGIHVSTAGGIYNAPIQLKKLNLLSGQIFTANQRRWLNKDIPESTTNKFLEAAEGLVIISHSSYLINFASANPEVVEKSHVAFIDELQRCKKLGIKYLVMHPGAHQKAGLEVGIEKISKALNHLLPQVTGAPKLLLENTAGAGTTIGRRLEELAAIRDSSVVPEQIGYCIDTAHAYSAGYKINDVASVNLFVKEIDKILGVTNVNAWHLNDSKVDFDSRRDRHEHFGEGTIGIEGLKALFYSPEFLDIPGVAETPGTDPERANDFIKLQMDTK